MFTRRRDLMGVLVNQPVDHGPGQPRRGADRRPEPVSAVPDPSWRRLSRCSSICWFPWTARAWPKPPCRRRPTWPSTLGASVTLIHIIERGAPEEVHGERHLTMPARPHAYLEEVAAARLPGRVHVEQPCPHRRDRRSAAGIVDHVEELAPDLIIMCTHGRGGLRDLLFGSIAQQVVARGTTPVLLIRPRRTWSGPVVCRQPAAGPVGRRPAHEQGLPVAADLAHVCGAELFLVFVVPTTGTLSGDEAATGRLLPGTSEPCSTWPSRTPQTILPAR